MPKTAAEKIVAARREIRAEQRKLMPYITAVKGRVSKLPRPVRRRYTWLLDLDFLLGRYQLFDRIGATIDARDSLQRLASTLKNEPREALPPVSEVG